VRGFPSESGYRPHGLAFASRSVCTKGEDCDLEIVAMTAKITPDHKPREGDRRSGVDRRKVDAGPPTRHERRRNLESRKPDVVEIEMSNSEWGALAHEPLPK
jgi:hypothetical protein